MLIDAYLIANSVLPTLLVDLFLWRFKGHNLHVCTPRDKKGYVSQKGYMLPSCPPPEINILLSAPLVMITYIMYMYLLYMHVYIWNVK